MLRVGLLCKLADLFDEHVLMEARALLVIAGIAENINPYDEIDALTTFQRVPAIDLVKNFVQQDLASAISRSVINKPAGREEMTVALTVKEGTISWVSDQANFIDQVISKLLWPASLVPGNPASSSQHMPG